MDRLTKFISELKHLRGFALFAIYLLGFVAFLNLKNQVFPIPDASRIQVSIPYPDATKRLLVNRYLEPLNNQLNELPFVKYWEAQISNDELLIEIETDPSVHIEEKHEAVNGVLGKLPQTPSFAAKPNVYSSYNAGNQRLAVIGLIEIENSQLRDKTSIREIDEKLVRKALLEIPEVKRIFTDEPIDKRVFIKFDPVKMAKLSISQGDVLVQLADSTTKQINSITSNGRRTSLILDGIESIEDLLTKKSIFHKGNYIKLSDIAEFEPAGDLKNHNFFNGKPYFRYSLISSRHDDMNVGINAVQKAIESLNTKLSAAGVKLTVIESDTGLLKKSYVNLSLSILIGSLITLVLLWWFSGNFKTTLTIIGSIPFSLAAVFIYKYFEGGSLNIMNISGVAFSLGVCVDMAILWALCSKRSSLFNALFISCITTLSAIFPITFASYTSHSLVKEMAEVFAIITIASFVYISFIHPKLPNNTLPNKWLGRIYSNVHSIISNKMLALYLIIIAGLFSLSIFWFVGPKVLEAPSVNVGIGIYEIESNPNVTRNAFLDELNRKVHKDESMEWVNIYSNDKNGVGISVKFKTHSSLKEQGRIFAGRLKNLGVNVSNHYFKIYSGLEQPSGVSLLISNIPVTDKTIRELRTSLLAIKGVRRMETWPNINNLGSEMVVSLKPGSEELHQISRNELRQNIENALSDHFIMNINNDYDSYYLFASKLKADASLSDIYQSTFFINDREVQIRDVATLDLVSSFSRSMYENKEEVIKITLHGEGIESTKALEQAQEIISFDFPSANVKLSKEVEFIKEQQKELLHLLLLGLSILLSSFAILFRSTIKAAAASFVIVVSCAICLGIAGFANIFIKFEINSLVASATLMVLGVTANNCAVLLGGKRNLNLREFRSNLESRLGLLLITALSTSVAIAPLLLLGGPFLAPFGSAMSIIFAGVILCSIVSITLLSAAIGLKGEANEH